MVIDKIVWGNMLQAAGRLLQEESARLSEIDSRFGDGDHGVTMGKIGALLQREVQDWQDISIRDFTEALGAKIMAIGGGSAGPLYGTLIGGLAGALEEETAIDGTLLKGMLAACREEMCDITTARQGDKTMMDALLPAVEAAAAATDDVLAVLAAAAEGAAAGATASEQYIAKYGRAKSYKEQTIGTPDAGAVSTSLLFQGLLEGAK